MSPEYLAGRHQVELVQGRLSAKRESLMQFGPGEDLDQRAADHEILLDLEALDPERLRTPLCDVVVLRYRRELLIEALKRVLPPGGVAKDGELMASRLIGM